MYKEAHWKAAWQRRRHELSRRQRKRTQAYVFRRFEWLQPISPARRMPTPDHPRTQGTGWRFCRKHTSVPRSRTSLPRTCRKKAMENDREEEFGPQSDNTSFPLTRDPFSLCLSLFYSSRREVICHSFTSHLFSVLSNRDTPRFPLQNMAT